jgi:hypothetical protein
VSPTTSGSSSSSGKSSSSSGSSSSGGPYPDGGVPAGDCHSDTDCPAGPCVAITPGGFRVCVSPPTVATACTGSLDQCCPAAQEACAGNAPCYVGPLVPVCSTLPPVHHNVCGVDQCSTNVDCAPGQICAPAGVLGLEIRACIAAHCKVDTDCTAHPGGVCAPVQAPCCNAVAGLFCVYPGSGGCRRDADCASLPGATTFCSPDSTSGVASCQTGSPACPS